MKHLQGLAKAMSLLQLRRALRRMEQRERTYFVIVMPGGFHIARLAIDYFPSGQRLVVIGNGVDRFEADWARRTLPGVPVLRTRAMLRHHEVLDAVFAAWDRDFGILDYDCFVLDPQLPARMASIDADTCMNAAFFRSNEDPPLKVPETFLLYFNVSVIRDLMARYDVGTRPLRWQYLPEAAKEGLAALGLSEQRLPEAHKPYFDTLRLLMMLGVAEGRPYRFVEEIPASPAPSEKAFHVGGVSDPRSIQGIWALRGSYFWRRVLDAAGDPGLQAHYRSRFGDEGAGALLERNRPLSEEISPEFLDFCERVLEGGRRAAG